MKNQEVIPILRKRRFYQKQDLKGVTDKGMYRMKNE